MNTLYGTSARRSSVIHQPPKILFRPLWEDLTLRAKHFLEYLGMVKPYLTSPLTHPAQAPIPFPSTAIYILGKSLNSRV